MQKHGIFTWAEAWKDPEFRKDVQSTFSKAFKRFASAG
jgi:hypothetical protein